MAIRRNANTSKNVETIKIIGIVSDGRIAVTKHLRTIDEMIGGAGLVTKKVEVIEEDNMMEVIVVREPVALPETGTQVFMAITKERRALYEVFSIGKVDLEELVDKNMHTRGEYLLSFVDLVLGDPPYNV